MNRLAKWMIRLYPARWRRRYGDELDALLADSGADAKTVADLLAGGIRMRFSSGSFLKLAVTLGVAGVLVGFGASFLRTPLYESRAMLEMTPGQNETIQQEQQSVMSRARLAAIISDPRLNLYNDERKNTLLEDVIDEMRSEVRIAYVTLPGKHSKTFNILFQYPDKLKAQQTVSALIGAFMEQNQRMQSGDRGYVQGNVLSVLTTASLPVTAVGPNRFKYALSGGLLGLLLAGAVALIKGGGHSGRAPMLATNSAL